LFKQNDYTADSSNVVAIDAQGIDSFENRNGNTALTFPAEILKGEFFE